MIKCFIAPVKCDITNQQIKKSTNQQMNESTYHHHYTH